MDNYGRIISKLKEAGIDYIEIDHDVSHSCEESKRFRDEQGLEGLGSKNIVFHCKGKFYLVTTHGDKQIKARNFKHEFGSKDIRFASQEEIGSIMDSTIGSIPPIGFSNEELPIYVDEEIFSAEQFIFNPSIPTKSIRINSSDLKKLYELMPNPIRYFRHSEEEFMLLDNLLDN